MESNEIKYDDLEKLPSLRKDWVRLVHRCKAINLGRNVIQNIKENGLIFNRSVTNIPPSQRGGTYPSPGYMVSAYNEELFWKKLQKDDFGCFDDAKYADTQIIFDMPIDEFCFLEKFGRVVVGKIDPKYIVGVIPNYNGTNKKITISKENVIKAQKTSISNPASITTPSTTEELFGILQQRFNTITKERMLRAIEDEKEDLLYDINEELSPKTPHITNQNRFDYER
jgi:hypothetical protein